MVTRRLGRGLGRFFGTSAGVTVFALAKPQGRKTRRSIITRRSLVVVAAVVVAVVIHVLGVILMIIMMLVLGARMIH